MEAILSDLLILKPASGIGAIAGQRLLTQAVEWSRQQKLEDDGAVIVFDLSDIDLATTSFIKSSVLPLFQSARLSTEAGAQTIADAFGLPALNVFPVLANAQIEVEALADEIFGRRGFPLLSLKMNDEQCLSGGRLVGFLDEVLMRTLRAWPGSERQTAANLQEKFREQDISQTAWSNRLNDLWRARLLRRIRQGKSWSYQPITSEVIYG